MNQPDDIQQTIAAPASGTSTRTIIFWISIIPIGILAYIGMRYAMYYYMIAEETGDRAVVAPIESDTPLSGAGGGGGGGAFKPLPPPNHKKDFERMDKDGSGKLAKEEIPGNERMLFDIMDTDKDGGVTLQEYIDSRYVETENQLPEGDDEDEGSDPDDEK